MNIETLYEIVITLRQRIEVLEDKFKELEEDDFIMRDDFINDSIFIEPLKNKVKELEK